jgi:hypothetical protein
MNPALIKEFNRLRRLAVARKAAGKTPELSPAEADRFHRLAWDIAKEDPDTGPVGDIDPDAIINGVQRPAFGLGVKVSDTTANGETFLKGYETALIEEREAKEAAAKTVAAALEAAISIASAAAVL